MQDPFEMYDRGRVGECGCASALDDEATAVIDGVDNSDEQQLAYAGASAQPSEHGMNSAETLAADDGQRRGRGLEDRSKTHVDMPPRANLAPTVNAQQNVNGNDPPCHSRDGGIGGIRRIPAKSRGLRAVGCAAPDRDA